ncbi:YcdB/YcdC domain-containing protein [Brassicibacter mesophilus]|uniref:YcdB/YcdC domain-containing protein n=1 Tax=Brassicibacter mesophilus TaxID=745119 RepID=UPI003D201F05
MKKRISLLLSILLVLTFVLPLQSYAQYDKELENAIKKAKSLLNITDDYDKFNYNINKYNDATEYQLNWYDSADKLGSINVNIDSDGMVRNYYSYKPSNEKYEPKLPKISKADGLKIANDFIKKVNPDIVASIKYQEDISPLNVYDRNYYYDFIRIENGIPFYDNSINISVNNITGEVKSFGCDWDKNLKFPDKNGIMSLEQAKQSFKEKLGLDLVYKLNRSSNETKAYLVYTTLNNNKAIDAKTGEIVDVYDYYYGISEKNAVTQDTADKSDLSPEELDAIKNAKDIISESEAEKVARDFLNISKDYKLNSINLYSDWENKDDFIWRMYFVEENKEESASISITIDAKTKEIKSFNKYISHSRDEKAKYDEDEVLQIAKDFIKSIQKEKYSQVEYFDIEQPIYRPMNNEEKPTQYHFNFVRKINSAYFLENGFNIGIDAVTGEITQYNYTWYKGELPSSDKVMSIDKAYNILFNDIGYELQYIGQNNNRYIDNDNSNKEVKLIYTAKKDKPLNIDAFSGELLYDYGRPYKEQQISKYNDINDSFAKMQIEILAEYGISLQGNEFKPKQTIAQKDFLYLLAKAKNYYFDIYSEEGNSVDRLYNYLINEGIVREDEKAPESTVAKQDAVKYIVRALGYDKVADIEGIYKVEFKDADQIDPELLGYVAIAAGLDIVSNDAESFNPSSSLTREQSAVIIYNLLNVK